MFYKCETDLPATERETDIDLKVVEEATIAVRGR